MAAVNTVGIDVGATKMSAAVVEVRSGTILELETIPTRPDRGGEAVLADCVELAERLVSRFGPTALGVGVCELVDLAGHVTSAYSFDWRELDLPAAFSHLGPARIEADVRAAAHAEAVFGAGRPFESFLYVNAGSGISSAFVQGGKPHAGARGNAILIGAGPLNAEENAGGVGIAHTLGAANAAALDRAATAGDRVAAAALVTGGRALGEATAFAVNLLDPEAVVLGGGVGLGSKLYRAGFEDALRDNVWADSTRQLPVIDAELADRAGVVGAALAADAIRAEALR